MFASREGEISWEYMNVEFIDMTRQLLGWASLRILQNSLQVFPIRVALITCKALVKETRIF